MDLFTKHYPEQANPEGSAYFYWYEFMRLIDGYDKSHALWGDFGDLSTSFWSWWIRRGEDLFMTGLPEGVEEVVGEEQIAKARSDGAYLVRVDGECSRAYLVERFKDFLIEKKISANAGRLPHAHEVHRAKYPFYQRPDVDSLRTILAVWKLRNAPKSKMPTLYEIGVELKLNPTAIIKSDDPPHTKRDKRNVMNATVGRYQRWGKNIILNAALGIFPKLTAPGA